MGTRGSKFAVALLLALFASAPSALDVPHNESNNINCFNCHDMYSPFAKLLRNENPHTPVNIDDTVANNLCWSCHNDVIAPYKQTHSSLTTDNGYGNWAIECRTCHDTHQQPQENAYGVESALFTGTVAAATSTTITVTGAGWTTDQYAGRVVYPNAGTVVDRSLTYRILANTADTLTVAGPMDLTKVKAGNSLWIIYGKLVRAQITTPNSGIKDVKLLRPTGANSFADGDATQDGICEACHTMTNHFRNDGLGPDPLHSNMSYPAGTKCVRCHLHVNGFRPMGGGAHQTHVVKGYGPRLECVVCHGSNTPPMLADGQDKANTTVCNNCHSAADVATAKSYWNVAGSSEGVAGTWAAVEGEISFCGSCHDATPGNTSGDGSGNPSPNIMGDRATYGFLVNGHGKQSGNYPRLSWQEAAAVGNPAANKVCSDCHDLTTGHFANGTKRLKAGWENDANNSTCRQCHDPGTVAVGAPEWYTTYTDFQNSAHYGTKCTACHDVHGASGANPAMTKADKQALCYQCHSAAGGVVNNSISTPPIATNIEQAFTLAGGKHPLGKSFTIGTGNYTLECVSCHNVHIVTGKYWDAKNNKSPVTRFANNTKVWGVSSGEKMDDYAGNGSYQTPTGETFTGAELPDYSTFCLDCHAEPPIYYNTGGSTPAGVKFGIDWNADPHGKGNAGGPSGYGTCPNWHGCGNAKGWGSGDDCTASKDLCWPVKSWGIGDQIYIRGPYDHSQRIAGVNYTLSCTNCHEAHGSGNVSMLRSNPNGGTGTVIWNTMCNNCHYYYSDWHAGMSCGNASCHETNSLHRMKKNTGGGTRTVDESLVLNYAFDNNLNDSGSYLLHGKWMDDLAGTFAVGKNGQAVVLDGTKNVQVGTRDAFWSTDAGKHGTWKYTEMKYNTTLEAWVYPTDTALTKPEYSIFTKHTGYSEGGYAFLLKNINGALRAMFYMQADNNSFAQGGKAGVRSAYSSVTIPFNAWTHVAATFDTNGPDKDPNDNSVGRIRIYVNGVDVTTSDGAQPGVGENSIYAYSENSPWNESICFNGNWCASEFSIGGFYGWQNAFIGMLDDAKVWNVTKNANYFSTYAAQAAPYISSVEGVVGTNQLTVTFSEGVYTANGSSGALTLADFMLTDTDNGRTITGVAHTAGGSKAVLTLSSPLDSVNDVGVDTVSAVPNGIFDKNDLAAGTRAVTIAASTVCPTGVVSFALNEPSGSAYVLDSQGLLSGAVLGGAATLTGSAYSGGGDASGRYILFSNNDSCLQASRALTLEARIKPAGLAAATGTTDYIKRILDRTGGGNYQLSVWRDMANINFSGYTPADGVASILFWARVVNVNGGALWKPVMTDYTICPIQDSHWYQVKVVWNSDKPGGTAGQPFVPADIYIDDQGTDDALAADGSDVNDANQAWIGLANCTNAAQTYQTDDTRRLYAGDSLNVGSGDFAIGANGVTPATSTAQQFNGLIDWIMWQDQAN